MIPNNLPLALIILDGFGVGLDSDPGNAIAKAHMPNYRRFLAEYPHTRLQANGENVGLPAGGQGTSEAGHLTIGAGRVVHQPAVAIDLAIANGEFYKNEVLHRAMRNVKTHDSKLHVMGLMSDGGVHASLAHVFAVLQLAKQEEVSDVYLHLFLDGRDVPERSAITYISLIQEGMHRLGLGVIASLQGRYYAMDRDTNWDRTEQAYRLLVEGIGHQVSSAEEGIKQAYSRGDATDYYIEPTVVVQDGQPLATFTEHDSIIFTNFRADRARQLSSALTERTFLHFPISHIEWFVCGLTHYDPLSPMPAAFPQLEVHQNLGQCLSAGRLSQLRIAETEKYAHVTYFFNSQHEAPVIGETRVLIPSLKVPSYAEAPDMSARKITSRILTELQKRSFDVLIVNFANADLVGHSGNFDATVQALETLDRCLGDIVTAFQAHQGTVLITGDHGNAEHMLYPDGTPCPSHTLNPVPFIVISESLKHAQINAGALKDLAPTILALLGLNIPTEMTGKNLLIK